MYCPNCGAQTSDNERFCSTCGSNLQNAANQAQTNTTVNQNESHIPPPPPPPPGGFTPPPGGFTPPPKVPSQDDNNGCLWGGIAFLIPLVGFILFALWNKEKPNTAKACLIGAIIGVVLNLIASATLIPFYIEMINSLGDLESYRVLLSSIF